jgi:hypothetical protein
MLILFLTMDKKPKERAIFTKKKNSGSSILDSIRSSGWNRRQLAKMVKLGGVFVSQASA